MSEEKQIEEMAKVYYEAMLRAHPIDVANGKASTYYATAFYNADYRKQSEGEWRIVSDYADSRIVECSNCEKQFYFKKKGQLNIDKMPHCPECGAKMKGGEE